MLSDSQSEVERSGSVSLTGQFDRMRGDHHSVAVSIGERMCSYVCRLGMYL